MDERRVTIDLDGDQIVGVLSRPELMSVSVAVLLHGGPGGVKEGPSDLFVKLADALAEVGISSFRFDFVGSNESSGDYARTSATHQVAQFHHVLEWLRREGYEQVAAVGESFGGTCALGGYRQNDVDALVLLWPAIWLLDAVFEPFVSDASLRKLRENGVIDIEGVAVGPSFIDDLLEHPDREKELRSVNVPTLLIHGDADVEVPVDQSRKAYELLEEPKRLIVVPDAEHCLRRPDEQALVISETTAWLLSHLRPSAEVL